MPFITTPDGTIIHYEEAGNGRPLVFVHGWAMSGHAWHFQRELADNNRLIAVDLRGHGQSTTVMGGFGIEAFAADLVALFEALELKDAVLVGWSLGVQVVLQAYPALRHRLTGLVFVGGNPRFSATDDYPHGQPVNEVKGITLRLRRDYAKTMGDFFRGMFAPGEPDPEQYQRIVHEIVMGGRSPEPEVARETLKILDAVDLRHMLPEVDRPVLIIHGSEDKVCLPGAAHYMARELPRVMLRIIEGSGHAPFMTRPDEFNDILRGFIALQDQGIQDHK